MRHYPALKLLAVLALASVPVSLRAQVAAAPSSTGEDWSSRRATYLQNVRDTLHDWEGKITDFTARAQSEGKSEDRRASAELNQSWSRVKAEAAKLEVASREDWDNGTAAFERASRDLANRWDGSNKSGK